MQNLRLLLPLCLLAACGLSEDGFYESFPADVCNYAEECVSGDAVEDGDPIEATCEEAMKATLEAFQNDNSCSFDSSKGQECLDLLAEGDCDDPETIESTCVAVYTGDTCNLTLSDFL